MLNDVVRVSAVTVIASLVASCAPGTDNGEWGLNERRSDGSALTTPTGQMVNFGVYVPIGVERSRLALASERELTIGPKVDIREADGSHWSAVSANAEVMVQAESKLGFIYGRGVTLLEGTVLDGFVRSSGRVVIDRAQVKQGQQADGPVSVESYRWEVSFPARKEVAMSLGNAEASFVPPAAYVGLRVMQASTAVLSAGTYYFDKLVVAEDGVLEIDNTSGAVYVWIRDEFTMSGVMIQNSPAPRVLFGYAGTETPKLHGAFRGVLVAPYADVALPNADSPHVGSFFARSLKVEGGASIVHYMFLPYAPDSFDPSMVKVGESGWVNPLGFTKGGVGYTYY